MDFCQTGVAENSPIHRGLGKASQGNGETTQFRELSMMKLRLQLELEPGWDAMNLRPNSPNWRLLVARRMGANYIGWAKKAPEDGWWSARYHWVHDWALLDVQLYVDPCVIAFFSCFRLNLYYGQLNFSWAAFLFSLYYLWDLRPGVVQLSGAGGCFSIWKWSWGCAPLIGKKIVPTYVTFCRFTFWEVSRCFQFGFFLLFFFSAFFWCIFLPVFVHFFYFDFHSFFCLVSSFSFFSFKTRE